MMVFFCKAKLTTVLYDLMQKKQFWYDENK